ncbi:BldC family transcriptional regulator [Rhodococcus sp. C3V]|uniref:BldC family transcriptional regulator n=1 Tax=Rhodococcus sp. C3V TaxID=3034165 RepID=UPI0023E13440|nr:BldC family transcriptional regulator [Rhodococcus sp. C3V]MDF3320108.1 BldC family transcriptional regulator [Rhodococcus sp. C3V]
MRRVGQGQGRDGGGDDELLTPKQVAELFHVNPKTVSRWAQQGRIGVTTTVGGHRRFDRAEIHALVNALTDPGSAS